MIKIEYESYLKLLASQIILEVLNKASKINELDSNSNSTTTTTITNNNNNEKKNQVVYVCFNLLFIFHFYF